MPSPIRINKYLSENGYCSRREADRLIKAGLVFVNDQEAQLGDKVTERDVVRVEGRDRKQRVEKIYVLLNKPAGATKDDLLNLVHIPEQLYPVGRVDTDSEGIALLTNDEVLSNRLTHPRYEHEKEYVVTVDRILNNKDIKQWQVGIELNDGKTLSAQVRKMDETRFAIILQEKRANQIARMCEAVGYKIVSIKQTRLLTLKMPSTYPTGNWRHLTEKEVEELKRATT